jgi:hypothetical protein
MRHYKIEAAVKTPNLPGSAPTKEVRIQLSNDNEVAGYGMPVTPSTFHRLFKNHFSELLKAAREQTLTPEQQNEIIAVDIGRESFMRILAQKGCEGIRVFFGQYETETGEKRNTIMAAGLDAKGQLLGHEKINPAELHNPDFDLNLLDDEEVPLLEEVGHGVTLNDLLSYRPEGEMDYRNLLFFKSRP